MLRKRYIDHRYRLPHAYPFQIWLHVPNERPHDTDPALSKPALYGIVEKKSMINLVSRSFV